MKKNLYTTLSVLLLLVFSACDKIGDDGLNPSVNDNPAVELNETIIDGVRYSILQSFTIGNHAVQLTANTTDTNIDTYNWVQLSDTWFTVFSTIIKARNLELIGRETGNPNYEAIGIIMRSWLFSILTDAYGDIPYEQGAQGQESGVLFPSYDEQEQIYTGPEGILAELSRANGLISTSSDPVDVEADVLYGGDMSKWQKFCNSLRLRLLMRISGKVDVAQQMQDIVDNDPIFTSPEDGAQLVYDGDIASGHPMFNLDITDFEKVRLSQTALDFFEAYNDPRLGQYARPTEETAGTNQPEFQGWVSGASSCDPDNAGSFLGAPYYDFPNFPIVGQNDRARGIIMTHAELEFILAEAAQKGWINGSAADHYRKGLESSMTYYEVEYTLFGWKNFEDFYEKSGAAYQDDPSQIIEQKWIALFFTGLEPYFDMRRHLAEANYDWEAIPFLSPACGNTNGDRLPLRFTYPEEEERLNLSNYQEAVDRMGGDSQNSKMWLLQ